jgi:hypothetical protein
MIVSAGFTAPDDGKKLASTTYRFSTSCALQSRSSADVAGSSPNRIVPFWWATPASGIRSPVEVAREEPLVAVAAVGRAAPLAGQRLAQAPHELAVGLLVVGPVREDHAAVAVERHPVPVCGWRPFPSASFQVSRAA